MLIEFVAGASLRVSIPWGEDYWLYLYMAVCFVVGGLVLSKQQQLHLFALIECSFNLFLLISSVYLPIFSMANRLDQTGGFNIEKSDLIHLVLVGAVLLYTFYHNPIIKKKKQ